MKSVTVDCTNRASQALGRIFASFEFTMLDSEIIFKGISKIRGTSSITYCETGNSFEDCFRIELNFEYVAHDDSRSRGKLMTSAFCNSDTFELGITWESTPRNGFVLNQATGILTSGKLKKFLMSKYNDFLRVCTTIFVDELPNPLSVRSEKSITESSSKTGISGADEAALEAPEELLSDSDDDDDNENG